MLNSRLEPTAGSDDWRLLVMDLEDALMNLEEFVNGGGAQPTPSKGKREMPSCVREVCSLVDSLVRQHAKCSEEGVESRVDAHAMLASMLIRKGHGCFDRL